MPLQKDFKRLVRARMQKTGESYTTARSQLLRQAPPAPPTAPPARDFASLAGMSDAAVRARTGCAWDRWVWALDRVRADAWPHPRIAAYIREKYRLSSWWAQTVTVGYERIKGLRAIGQRRSGTFDANKSRTFALPLGRLYRAFRDSRLREKWLPGVRFEVRTATRDKSIRVTWADASSVHLNFYARGPGRSAVQLQHGGLRDRQAATDMKAWWGARLEALAASLPAGATTSTRPPAERRPTKRPVGRQPSRAPRRRRAAASR